MRHPRCTSAVDPAPTKTAMINPDRLTVKATEALNEAVDLARRAGNPLVYDLHLLLALLSQDEGIVVPILQKLGVSVAALRETVGREMARYPEAVECAADSLARAQPGIRQGRERRQEARRRVRVDRALPPRALRCEGHESRNLLNGRRRDPRRVCSRRSRQFADPIESRIRIPKTNTRRSSATRAISPTRRARASSIR